MSSKNIISKTDEYGNVWVMVAPSDKKKRPPVSDCHNRPAAFFEAAVRKAIESKIITKGRYTASVVAQLAGLNHESKSTINSTANALRVMGFSSKRIGSGRFFIIE